MAILDSIENAIKWLEEAKRELLEQRPEEGPIEAPRSHPPTAAMAWGSYVSPIFRERVRWPF
jgi:hypothetical protein